MKARSGVAAPMAAAAIIGLLALSSAHALPVISNGGFESGFASWTRADQLGSEGTFTLQTGTASPVSGDPVPAPPGGTTAAMTDALGPGSHVLYQDFFVPLGGATLNFDLFLGNRANAFFTPANGTLDFSGAALNQQARVDIMRTTADPFSVAAGDVFLNLYQTRPGDPLISGYNTISRDISALLAAQVGQTLRLRFAEADNVFTFQMGVDNVSFAVPEPVSTLLFGAALAALVATRRSSARGAMT